MKGVVLDLHPRYLAYKQTQQSPFKTLTVVSLALTPNYPSLRIASRLLQ